MKNAILVKKLETLDQVFAEIETPRFREEIARYAEDRSSPYKDAFSGALTTNEERNSRPWQPGNTKTTWLS